MTEKQLIGKVASEGAEQLPSIGAVVRIVNNKDEITKVEFGDVVVAPKITPDYVRILKKAKAIVTDLGGDTSHAVLLSREHGLPCIIDTKTATSTFQDEEFVELNLSEGYVKSISRMEYDLLLEQEKDLVKTQVEDKKEDLKQENQY